MTHLMYAYFIINAYLAGLNSKQRRIWFAFLVLLFGIPMYMIDFFISFITEFIWWLNNKMFIISFFRLWFTDRYKFSKIRMDYAKEGLITGNWFKKQFIKQLDKKYNYGITKESEGQYDRK